jgi:sterol desaturase/sphingolipid hydroxylase (fatty acid hydroxylase superfamily)
MFYPNGSWFSIFTLVSLRYFVIAGLAFLIWYVLLKKKVAFKKIQLRFPTLKDYQREILYSLMTIVIFTLVPWIILGNPEIKKHTTWYSDINQHSKLYFWLAFPLMLIMHDTYFYWMHRLMHQPKLFKVLHLVHHQSVNPSPWAAFAFHPLEAVIEIGILVVYLFTIPVMKIHLFFFFLFMMVYNVYGHLGWELYPKNFHRTWIGKWINTSINHNQHHQYFKGNYGLYFLFWDRLMGTIRTDYNEKYEEVSSRRTENEKAA